MGFDFRSEFSFTDGSMGINVIILGTGMSSSVYIHNKNKFNLILGEWPTQGLYDTTVTEEAKYPINFAQRNKRFALHYSLHYNGSNSFLFDNATQISKQKTLK